jgi:phage gp36-like protein
MATFEFRVDGVLTNATSVKFSSPDAVYGLRRTDNATIVIADGTNWTNDDVGEYSYDIDSLLSEGLSYDYYIEVVYAGETTYLQRHVTTDGEAETTADIRFVIIDADGVLINADGTVYFSNPAGSAGVVDTSDGATIAADASPLSSSGTLYTGSWATEEGHVYRYYIEAEVDDVTYYLPRTTSYITSAALVFGRYTNSAKIEQRFGVENVHKWLGIDEGDQAVDYGLRFHSFIQAAEQEIDDYLRNTLSVPASTVPLALTDIASDLAAVRMYEARGVIDFNPESGQPQHRLHYQSKRAWDRLKMIKSGELRLATDEVIRYPRFTEFEPEQFESSTDVDGIWEQWQ